MYLQANVSPSQCSTTLSQVGLNIGVWNSDGLANKALELEIFLKSHNIGIMLLSKTHFYSRLYYKLHAYDIHQATHPADRLWNFNKILSSMLTVL